MKIKKESDSIWARIWKAIAKKADDPDTTRYRLTDKGEAEVYPEKNTNGYMVAGGEDVSGQ